MSTALISSIRLFFQRFKYPFKFLLSTLPSNSNLNTNLSNIKIELAILKSLVNYIRLSPILLSIFFLISTINLANAALTATTANTIERTKCKI